MCIEKQLSIEASEFLGMIEMHAPVPGDEITQYEWDLEADCDVVGQPELWPHHKSINIILIDISN